MATTKKAPKTEAKPKRTNNDVREAVTKKIVEQMSQNNLFWRRPWSGTQNSGNPCNFVSGRRYTGINPWILMISSWIYNYDSKHWGSFKAWMEKTGGHVKKGEHGTQIVLFTMIPERDPKTKKPKLDASGKEKKIPLMREFSIFNVDQVQAPEIDNMLKWPEASLVAKAIQLGIKTDSLKPKQIATKINEAVQGRLDKYRVIGTVQNYEPDFVPAEAFMAASGATFVHRGVKAQFSHIEDEITLPPKRTFESMAAYYETAFHEMIHWTGHGSRLNRREKAKGKNRPDDYAFEELVAEIGACFICAELNVPHAETLLAQSAAYMKGWLASMNSDPKYIFDAATLASEAADYLLKKVGLGNKEFEEES